MKKLLSVVFVLLVFSFVFAQTNSKSSMQDAVTWMYNNDMTSKSTLADFAANDTLNREQSSKFFSVFASKIYNKSKALGNSCKFSDIQKADKTLTGSIKDACELGIMKGGNGKFLPKDRLTYAEAITMLMRIIYGSMTEPSKAYYTNYYTKAKELGLIGNVTMSSFISRGEMGNLLYKASSLSSSTTIAPTISKIDSTKGFTLNAKKMEALLVSDEEIKKANADANLLPMSNKKYLKTSIELDHNSIIYGLSIDADINLGTNGFVRIILIGKENNVNEEYLIHESSSLLTNQNTYNISNACEETCILPNGFVPDRIDIQIKDTSSVQINNVAIVDQKTDFADSIKSNLPTAVTQLKSLQKTSKLEKVEEMISDNGLEWKAGNTSISIMTYKEKKNLFLSGEVPDLPGFEYYVGGVYTVPGYQSTPSGLSNSVGSTNFVDSFDWRNVHGKDRTTSIKDQGQCGSCWTFSVVGATESLTNLYFNRPLNLDLSEQNILTNSAAGSCNGGQLGPALDYIRIYGVVDEQCFGYSAVSIPSYSRCSNPSSIVKIGGDTRLLPTTDEALKKALIKYGPLSVGVYSLSHAMVLVGFDTDTDGQTIWIFKNSRGIQYGDNGYRNIKTDVLNFYYGGVYALYTPVNNNGSTSGITCEDNDGDTYCNRGISQAKPSSCPTSCKPQADCNDADSSIQIYDSGYNCIEAPTVVIPTCTTTQHLENNICVSNTKSCTIINGIGQQTRANNARGTCAVVSCNAGYELQNNNCIVATPVCAATQHLENNICVNNTKSCIITHGGGQQTWANNARGACSVISCNNGYQIQGNSCVVAIVVPTCTPSQHLENNICISNIRSCTITNGIGQQNRANNIRGTCIVASCNNGYQIQGNSCIAVTVVPTCNSTQHLENNICVNNTKSCSITNGIGQQAWVNNARGSCSVVSCSNGYQIQNNSCVQQTTCNINLHMENNVCVSNMRFCTFPNGTGQQTWSNNARGICVVHSCNIGYQIIYNSCVAVNVEPTCTSAQHLENNVCVSNTRSCSVWHGSGNQTWVSRTERNGTWRTIRYRGSCMVYQCDSGYYVSGGGSEPPLSCIAWN